jgi:hypothetical protein
MKKVVYNYNTATGEAGIEEQAASAAILAATGVPIPPDTLAKVSKFFDSTMDIVKEFWSWTGWGDKSNTEKVPGGVVWFWKYAKGAPSFGQPVINEDCSKGYFVQYQKDLAKRDMPEATPKAYAELEQLFNAYYPAYVQAVNEGKITEGGDQNAVMIKTMRQWEAIRQKAIADANIKENGGVALAGMNIKYVLGGVVALILIGIFFSKKA